MTGNWANKRKARLVRGGLRAYDNPGQDLTERTSILLLVDEAVKPAPLDQRKGTLTMKTPKPPRIDPAPPRNDFGPREVLGILDLLARRQHARLATLSPLTRLGRGGAA